MNHVCEQFRSDELTRALEGAVVVDCAECEAWARRQRAVATALRDVRRVETPVGLERAVRGVTLGTNVAKLTRVSAPEDLDLRVAADLADGGQSSVGRVRALDRQVAPAVLDRLVAEELERPALHRVERFAGSLDRRVAPVDLRTRFHRSRRAATALAGGLATAAAVVLWAMVGRGAPVEEPRSYSFEVVRLGSAAELDPMARAMVDSLSSGLVHLEADARRRSEIGG